MSNAIYIGAVFGLLLLLAGASVYRMAERSGEQYAKRQDQERARRAREQQTDD